MEHGGHHQGDNELVGGDHADEGHVGDDHADEGHVGDDHADEGHVGDIHLGRYLQGGSIWKPSIICAGRAP